jgi:hypothetical protein
MEGDAETHGLAARSLPMTAPPPRASGPSLRHLCGAQQGTVEPALLASRAGTGDHKRTAGPACPHGPGPKVAPRVDGGGADRASPAHRRAH